MPDDEKRKDTPDEQPEDDNRVKEDEPKWAQNLTAAMEKLTAALTAQPEETPANQPQDITVPEIPQPEEKPEEKPEIVPEQPEQPEQPKKKRNLLQFLL